MSYQHHNKKEKIEKLMGDSQSLHRGHYSTTKKSSLGLF